MAKIPFSRTVADAYELAFTHLGSLAVAAGAWVAGLSILAALVLFASSTVPFLVDRPEVLRIGELLGEFLVSLVWLRAILQDEAPNFLPRFGRRESRYVIYTIIITILIEGVLRLLGVILLLLLSIKAIDYGLTAIPKLWTDVFQTMTLPLLLIPVSGWLLALPAVALDEEGDVIGRAWRRGRGNSIALGLGTTLSMAPITGLQLMLEDALGGPVWKIATHEGPGPTALQTMLATEVDLLLSFFGAAVISGFLALAYRQLVMSDGTETALPAE